MQIHTNQLRDLQNTARLERKFLQNAKFPNGNTELSKINPLSSRPHDSGALTFMGTNSAYSYKAVNLLSIHPSIESEVLIPLLESSTDQRLRISLTATNCPQANNERNETKSSQVCQLTL